MPELSSRNQSLLAVYSAEIEVAADRIITESHSPATRRQALTWKAEAIPIVQMCLLNTDPVAAVLDAWAFIFQMSEYIDRPVVKQTLGDSYPVIADTLKNMEAEMERRVLWAAPKANIAELRQIVGTWARAHPIQASLAGRQSAEPDMIRRASQSELGTTGSIKTLAEGLGDLTARLDTYNLYLPKQARWQAELLLSDVTRDPKVGTLMSTASKSLSSLDRIPGVTDRALETARADIEGQRLGAQTFIREERLQVLSALHQERVATLAALDGERLAATADLRGERQKVLQALVDQEAAVEAKLDATSAKEILDLKAKSQELINYFFLRALGLMLLTVFLCTLVAWILLRRYSVRRSDLAEWRSRRAA